MNTSISDRLKGILLKVAVDLKPFGWHTDAEAVEIDLSQGHIELIKEYKFNNIDILTTIDLTFVKSEQSEEYYIVYDVTYSLWDNLAGGSDVKSDGDVNIGFTEKDIHNKSKISLTATTINDQVVKDGNDQANKYVQSIGDRDNDMDYRLDHDLDR